MAKVAFVLADDFEDSEFKKPYDCVREAGHKATVVGTETGKEVKGKKGKEKFTIESTPDHVSADQFDALIIPGGYSPDKLRMNEEARRFVREMERAKKPFAVICHAPWLLISAGLAKSRRMTSYYTIQDDLRNAGADWVDEEVVRDQNWVTSRQPDDIPAFNRAMAELLSGVRARQAA